MVLALIIEHLTCFIRKMTINICLSFAPSGLHIKAPALTKSFQNIVYPGTHNHQLSLRSTIKVPAAIGVCLHQAFILIKHYPRSNNRIPRRIACKVTIGYLIFFEVELKHIYPPKKISTPIVLIPLGIKSSRSARLLTFLPKTSLAMYMVLYYDEKVFIFFSQASNHHVHEKCYG